MRPSVPTAQPLQQAGAQDVPPDRVSDPWVMGGGGVDGAGLARSTNPSRQATPASALRAQEPAWN